MLQRIPFRFKLFAAGALALLAVTAVHTYIQAALVEEALTRQVMQRAEAERPFFRSSLASLLVTRDYATIADVFRESAATNGLAHLALVDARGHTVACEGWDPEQHGLPVQSANPVPGPDGTLRLPFSIPIEYAGQNLGTLYYGVSWAPIEAAYAEILRRGLIVGAVSLVVALMMMEWLHALIMRPLTRLREASEAIRKGEFEIGLPPTAGNDIGRLTESFRYMASEISARIRALETSEAAQRELLEEARVRESQLADARDKAEEAARTKARFLATMSHEIRTPLNGVLGLSSVLLDQRFDPEQRRLVQLIQDSGEQLLAIVNDVLDYSKLDAGKLVLERTEFAPGRLTQDTVESFRGRAAAKGLQIGSEVAAGVAERFAGDAIRVRQILDNLVANAIKFTMHGRVDVSLRMLDDARASLEWRVTDTGIGIPPERRGELFQDFMQVDSTTARRFGGTGLGLAICRRLVGLMGGDIWVESQVGKGSAFTFRLPTRSPDPVAAPVPPPAVRAVPAPVRRGSGLYVLAAEDNEINRYVIEKLLEGMGHDVVFAADGAEAVELAGRLRFDVVLMDIQMPTVDGITAAGRIRAMEGAGAHVPIIALTAHAMAGDRESYLKAGMDDYVAKPIDPDALARALARVTGRGHGLRLLS
jgi:signal transduction histidine kinase/CheY-like chemotaxis protein